MERDPVPSQVFKKAMLLCLLGATTALQLTIDRYEAMRPSAVRVTYRHVTGDWLL